MGIRQLSNYEYCDLCGKQITIEQYLENHIGWDIDYAQRQLDKEKRQAYCKKNHTKTTKK